MVRIKIMKPNKTYAKTLLRLTTLSQEDFEMATRVLLVRQMMEHRGISNEDIVEHSGQKPGWVARVTSGRLHYWTSRESKIKALDEVEDSITRITQARGGIPAVCCTQAGYVEAVGMARRHEFLEV